MNVGLNDILTLVGHLDDAPGFDTPRERFRRFLIDRIADASGPGDTASASLQQFLAFVERGQFANLEQHRRATQDALVALGRLLGFEISFGSYEPVNGALKFDGLWRSNDLVVTLDIRSHEVDRGPIGLDDLARALIALPHLARREAGTRVAGLCIITPAYGDRARLGEAIAANIRHDDIRVASVRSLLWLAEAVGAGRLRHDEIVRLLTTAGDFDFVVDLMTRVQTREPADVEVAGGSAAPAAQPPAPSPAPSPALAVATGPVGSRAPADPRAGGQHRAVLDPGHWLVTIDADDRTTPEQFVHSVIGVRRLLGIRNSTPASRPHDDDWVCFLIRGTGIVGHAQIDDMAEAPPPLRDAHRFSAVYVLKNVEMYEAPVGAAPEQLNQTPDDEGRMGPLVTSISAEQFAALTGRSSKRSSGLRSVS